MAADIYTGNMVEKTDEVLYKRCIVSVVWNWFGMAASDN